VSDSIRSVKVVVAAVVGGTLCTDVNQSTVSWVLVIVIHMQSACGSLCGRIALIGNNDLD
jgi:hypothetical protein